MKKMFVVLIAAVMAVIMTGCGAVNATGSATKAEIEKDVNYVLQLGEECVMRTNDSWKQYREVLAIVEVQPNGDSLTVSREDLLYGNEINIWVDCQGQVYFECFDPEIGSYLQEADVGRGQ